MASTDEQPFSLADSEQGTMGDSTPQGRITHRFLIRNQLLNLQVDQQRQQVATMPSIGNGQAVSAVVAAGKPAYFAAGPESATGAAGDTIAAPEEGENSVWLTDGRPGNVLHRSHTLIQPQMPMHHEKNFDLLQSLKESSGGGKVPLIEISSPDVKFAPSIQAAQPLFSDEELAAIELIGESRQLSMTIKADSEYVSIPINPPLPVASDELLSQLTTHLVSQPGDRHEVTIQLHPESLGRVEAKVVLEHQELTARFIVQNHDVRELLLKQVDSLREALIAKGIEVKAVAVELAAPEKMTGLGVGVDQQPAQEQFAGSFSSFGQEHRQPHHPPLTGDPEHPGDSNSAGQQPAVSTAQGMLSRSGALHILG
ncbi:MAG: flagellar hook-length control protein FliK [Deltaproteobacteria bacterium]|nr:flagellar hook-length control protein FliK [Candidatus Anaeroferrophillus wilburensis]MBN2888490.1 flagellar hook-length control protein FliK [Deltaproteobacteria bacterium]